MEVEIRPEPPEDVRRAIELALAAAAVGERVSPWWQAGIEESLDDDAG
jgi:hypothetical protein